MLLIKYNLSGKKWIFPYISPIFCTLIHFPFVSPIFTVINTEKYSGYTLINFINLIEGGYRLTNEFSWSGVFLFPIPCINTIFSVSFNAYSFFAELLYMLYFYRISINDFYIIKQLTLSYKISKFLQKFCLVFCYCHLPDESILISTAVKSIVSTNWLSATAPLHYPVPVKFQ